LGLCLCKCLTETKADTVKAQLLDFRCLSASLAWLAAAALVLVFFFLFYLSCCHGVCAVVVLLFLCCWWMGFTKLAYIGNPVHCVSSQFLGSPPWTTDLGLCLCKCLTETKADTVKAQLLHFRCLSASLAWLAAVALVPVPLLVVLLLLLLFLLLAVMMFVLLLFCFSCAAGGCDLLIEFTLVIQ
jgi:hypothetical protein